MYQPRCFLKIATYWTRLPKLQYFLSSLQIIFWQTFYIHMNISLECNWDASALEAEKNLSSLFCNSSYHNLYIWNLRMIQDKTKYGITMLKYPRQNMNIYFRKVAAALPYLTSSLLCKKLQELGGALHWQQRQLQLSTYASSIRYSASNQLCKRNVSLHL